VTGFVNQASTTLGRESDLGPTNLTNPNIPKSSFYPPAERDTGGQSRVIQFPIRTE
jgi:hypothetical protein